MNIPRPSAPNVEEAIACLEIASSAGAIAGWVLQVVRDLAATPPAQAPVRIVFELVAGEYADRQSVGMYASRELAEAQIVYAVLNDPTSPIRDHSHIEIVEHVVEVAR